MPLASSLPLATSVPLTLGHRFFIDPLDAHSVWWVALVPMAFLIAMAYKAVRLPTLDRYWQQVLSMTVQVTLAMLGLAAGSFILIELFVRAMNR